MTKLNKVTIEVKKENQPVKVDKRKFNTGRPVNKKSARQLRLAQQDYYETQNAKFVNGNTFKLSNDSAVEFHYTPGANGLPGCLFNGIGTHECNITYIGRTKVTGYTFVLNKKVNVEVTLSMIFVYL